LVKGRHIEGKNYIVSLKQKKPEGVLQAFNWLVSSPKIS